MASIRAQIQTSVHHYVTIGFDLDDLFIIAHPASEAVGVFLVEHFPEEFTRGTWWGLRAKYRRGR